MFRSMRLLLAMLALLSLTAIGVRASPPSASNSTTPGLIRLVGTSNGSPDGATGQFIVVARNLANNPVGGCSIVIDLSNCPDLAFCSDQLDQNALTNCAAKTVRKFANALGEVTFTLVGSSAGAGHASSLAHGGRIFGNGVLLATPSAASFDLDGSGGVGAGDLSVWLTDFGSDIGWERSDYDGDGTIGAGDLSEWLTVFGASGSSQSCAASCP